MPTRHAATLVEVLVAIFVTSIGLLGLLALFPLGVVNMARAIQEERAAEACANAAAASKITGRVGGLPADLRSDDTVSPYFTAPPNPLDPGNPGSTLSTRSGFGPGYPVYVDPIGAFNYAALPIPQQWVGRSAPTDAPTVPRVAPLPAFYSTSTLALKWCTLLDDINFGMPSNGTPVPPGVVQRDERYSWAYLYRMPSVSASPPVIDMSVVVYKDRPIQVSTGLQVVEEVQYQAVLTPPNTVSIAWGGTQQRPNVRKGLWILDATVVPDPRGFFYRIANVTDTGPTSMDLETQTTLLASGQSVIVIMQNVIEVFDRNTIPGAP